MIVFTSFVSSIRRSSSSFLRNFWAISSSDKREIKLRKRSRRSAGPSPNKPKEKKITKEYYFLEIYRKIFLQIGSPN